MTNESKTVNTSAAEQLLCVAESMAFLHGRATLRLRVPWGRGLLTIDDTEDGLVYTEQWRKGYIFDEGSRTPEQAVEALAGEQG